MRTNKRSKHRMANLTLSAALAGIVFAAVAIAPAAAGSDDFKKHRGYVDGSRFAELANDEDTLIEVTIRGPLLKIVSKAVAKQDDDLGEFLEQIVSINAVVVDIDDSSDRAERLVREMTEHLENDNWERLARIREDDSNIVVFALYDDEIIDGITVMVFEHSEMVFANIAGRIDLELIGDLGGKLNIPGLDLLHGDDWKVNLKESKKRRRRD